MARHSGQQEPDTRGDPRAAPDALAELENIQRETRAMMNRRISVWGVRWIIGFGLIWVLVRIWPSLAWLWFVGVFVAILSLVLMLFVDWLLTRQLQQKITRLKALCPSRNGIASADD